MTSRIGLGPYPLTAAALLLALVAPAAAAPSSGTDQDTALCERAIVQGAQRGGLPTEVLESISLAETGRLQDGKLRPWPWAINREGQGYWFASRDQALAFARQSLAEGRTSFDVGCFQINYRWHGQAFPSLEAMFDPDQGADFAARFLRDLYAEFGSWSGAAGAYHSRTPELASDYSARFDRILASVGNAPPLVVADAATDADAPATPARKIRTRMLRKPLIITINPGQTFGVSVRPGAGPVPEIRAEEAGTIELTQDEPGDRRF